ncbi:DUF6308 family protein [Paenarthrobacter sp. CAP02]|uniref:DUF6308 family protein n=1 Tax=Paenarthrobacter sp. CAP02 TaxID=3158144 RepID=UPI0032DAAF2B
MRIADHIDLSPGMPAGIGEQRLDDIVSRVRAYCGHPMSGWHTYDLPSFAARRAGHFTHIAPWSLLWADALGGRITPANLASFTQEYRSYLAEQIRDLPSQDLKSMEDSDVEKVALLCRTGFAGAWAPKMTKLLALYRPDVIPVLDGHVAVAMGFERTAFSAGRQPRWEKIRRTLFILQRILKDQAAELTHIREKALEMSPDLGEATDVRLLDIILWTSQDDRLSRSGSPANYWRDRGNESAEVSRAPRMDPVAVYPS